MLDIRRSYIYGTKVEDGVPFALVRVINLWIVANYLKFHDIRDSTIRTRDLNADNLARSLGLPSNTVSAKNDQPSPLTPEAQHVIAAIKRVQELVDNGNLVAADIFKPLLLRLVLCGRHKFPLESLCNDYPDFFEGWETLLDEEKLRAEDRLLYPSIPSGWNKPCAKCRIRQVADTAACKATILDHVSWANAGGALGGGIQWLCPKCYKLPSLEEWEMVKGTLNIAERAHKEQGREDPVQLLREKVELDRQQSDITRRQMELTNQQAELQSQEGGVRRQLRGVESRLSLARTSNPELEKDARARLAKFRGY